MSMLTSKWRKLLDIAVFITSFDRSRTEWMLFRYAAGFKPGSSGFGMGVLERDMLGGRRRAPLLVVGWLRLSETEVESATRWDLEVCDLLMFSLYAGGLDVFLVKRPILSLLVDTR
jgi:hypothetical protein